MEPGSQHSAPSGVCGGGTELMSTGHATQQAPRKLAKQKKVDLQGAGVVGIKRPALERLQGEERGCIKGQYKINNPAFEL